MSYIRPEERHLQNLPKRPILLAEVLWKLGIISEKQRMTLQMAMILKHINENTFNDLGYTLT